MLNYNVEWCSTVSSSSSDLQEPENKTSAWGRSAGSSEKVQKESLGKRRNITDKKNESVRPLNQNQTSLGSLGGRWAGRGNGGGSILQRLRKPKKKCPRLFLNQAIISLKFHISRSAGVFPWRRVRIIGL